MKLRKEIYVVLVLCVFTALPSQGVNAEDTTNIAQELRLARLNENPIKLRQLIDQPGNDSIEFDLSKAFLESISASDMASLGGLQNWIQNYPGAPTDMKVFAYERLGYRYMLYNHYAKAAEAFQSAFDLRQDELGSDLHSSLVFAKIAAGVPPVRMSDTGAQGARLPIQTDFARQKRIPVSMSGHISPMIVDTGAEVSVVAQSVAEKSGLQFLKGDVTVGTVTDDVVGQLAVASSMNVGGIIFENVLFLVLPDEMLTFAGGQYFVDGIVGLPVFAKAGQIQWKDNTSQFLLGDTVDLDRGSSAPMFWHDAGMGLEVTYQGSPYPVFFDSGASRSSGTLLFKGILGEKEANDLVTVEGVRTGVGGAKKTTSYKLPEVPFGFVNHVVTLKNVTVAAEKLDEAGGDIAVIGSDVPVAVQSFAIDFKSMKYRVRPNKDIE